MNDHLLVCAKGCGARVSFIFSSNNRWPKHCGEFMVREGEIVNAPEPCPNDPFNGKRSDRPCMCDRCITKRRTDDETETPSLGDF